MCILALIAGGVSMFAAGAMERYEELFTSRRMIDKVIQVYEQQD